MDVKGIRWFTKEQGTTRSTTPSINITPKGTFSLNKASISKINPPCRVNAGYDAENGILAIKPDYEGDLKLDLINKGGGGRMTSIHLLKWLKEIGAKEGKYEGEWNDLKQCLIFKLKTSN